MRLNISTLKASDQKCLMRMSDISIPALQIRASPAFGRHRVKCLKELLIVKEKINVVLFFDHLHHCLQCQNSNIDINFKRFARGELYIYYLLNDKKCAQKVWYKDLVYKGSFRLSSRTPHAYKVCYKLLHIVFLSLKYLNLQS